MALLSGFLIQADSTTAKMSLVEWVRSVVADCETRHGWRPSAVLVWPGGEWPDAVDGVRVIPSPTIPYLVWILLVRSINSTSEDNDVSSSVETR